MVTEKTIHFETILLQTSSIDHLCDNFQKHDIGYAVKCISKKLWYESFKQNKNYDDCTLLCDTAIEIMRRYTDGYNTPITYHAIDIIKSFKRIKYHIDILKSE